MRVAVVGLGKIGLPLSVQIAERGGVVTGVDINPQVVESVNAGIEPFPGEHALQEKLGGVVATGNLTATTDFSIGISEAEVVIVVVPVVVDKSAKPDFSAIDMATREIAKFLRDGALVIYETTLPVHTTRQHFLPLLESDSGLTAGSGFYLCHSPERVFTGRVFADLRKYPKLVGGVDKISGSKAKNFYENVLQFDERSDLPRKNGVWDLGSAEAAELAKLAETTYRNINIAFANELALHADDLGIDVNEVIDASNSQPFSHIHRPGISVGGHCIPVYPKFYLSVDTEASIPAAAVTLNESMPGRVAQVVADKLKGLGSPKAAILGLSYRGGVKELAFSGTFPLAFRLRELGIDVSVHDSLFSADEIREAGFKFYSIGEEIDGVVVHTDHHEYATLTESDFPTASFIYDGRGILELTQFPNVEVNVLGRPGNLLQ